MFPLGRPCMPGEVLPLRIFEPRYVSMLQDLMSSPEPQFGVVLIDRGSEVGGGDVRRDIGTLVSVIRVEEFAPEQFSVLAIGTDRLRVLQWLDDNPYPRAVVQKWPTPSPSIERGIDASMVDLESLLDSDALRHVPIDQRLFTLATMLPIGALDLQILLEADSIHAQRSVMKEILRHLEDLARFGDPQTD
ncbi:MAG: LON peptidase substrate-binding domain-containing protein [Actinomycetota bacterium]